MKKEAIKREIQFLINEQLKATWHRRWNDERLAHLKELLRKKEYEDT